MRAYIIRRLLLMIPTLFLVTIIVFFSVRFIPGSIIDLMLAEMAEESGLGQELTAAYIEEALGLDEPVHKQYAKWLGVLPNEFSDDTYVEGRGQNYVTDLYNLRGVFAEGKINSVTVYINSKAVGGKGEAAKTRIKTNGLVVSGTAIQLTKSYRTYNTTYTTNPQTGNEWSWVEIKDLQVGVALKSPEGEATARCTQVWVIIDYAPLEQGLDTITLRPNTAGDEANLYPYPPDETNWDSVDEDHYFSGLFQGSLGNSLWKGTPVTDEILARVPISLELAVLALTIGMLLAIPIGAYSAIRQDTRGDYIARTFAILFISLPTFWTGTMVTVYPSVWWNWSPPVEYIPVLSLVPFAIHWHNIPQNLPQFLLPAFLMGMLLSGSTMRMTRTMMLEVLRQDYIKTAWAKGLKERTIIIRHAMKNALIPIVTMVGLMIPMLIAGTVILEEIFVLPGMGRLMIEALNSRDYPIVSGINVMLATFILLLNLLVDLTYGWLDPRVHYQ